MTSYLLTTWKQGLLFHFNTTYVSVGNLSLIITLFIRTQNVLQLSHIPQFLGTGAMP